MVLPVLRCAVKCHNTLCSVFSFFKRKSTKNPQKRPFFDDFEANRYGFVNRRSSVRIREPAPILNSNHPVSRFPIHCETWCFFVSFERYFTKKAANRLNDPVSSPCTPSVKCLPNNVFASGQAIREASLTVLRPPVHGSETSRTQKRSLCGFAASSGVLNPQENKHLPEYTVSNF